MALQECPDCHGPVSQRAKECPRCGCPVDQCVDQEEGNNSWVRLYEGETTDRVYNASPDQGLADPVRERPAGGEVPPVWAEGWILPESTLTDMGKRLWKFAVLSAFLAAVTGLALTRYLISIPQILQVLVDMATSFAEGWGEGISVLEVSGIFLLVVAWILTVGFQELYDFFVSRYLEYVHDISRSIEAAGPDESKLSEELSRTVAIVNSTSAFGKIRIDQNADARHFDMKFRSPRLISVMLLILMVLAA